MIGRASTLPGWRMSISTNEMPSCFLALGSERTRQKHQSANWAPRGPDLLAVDLPVVALVLQLGLQRGEVGAGVGLGVALAPAQLARMIAGRWRFFWSSVPYSSSVAPNMPGPMPWIGLVTPMRAISCCSTRASAVGEPAAAVFLRPGRRAPALLAHPLAPEVGVGGRAACRPPSAPWSARAACARPAAHSLRARRALRCGRLRGRCRRQNRPFEISPTFKISVEAGAKAAL